MKRKISFRLLMELYSFLYDCDLLWNNYSSYYVSVSLWSYIHSYNSFSGWLAIENPCFRLLMELYSFLFNII